MLTEAIIISIITAISTIAGSWLINRKEHHKDAINRAKREQFVDSNITLIQKKLDEHNHYAQRFSEIEKSIVRIDTTLLSIVKERS